MLCDFYPELTKKELVICEMIICASWDIGDSYHNAIVENITLHYKDLFYNDEVVESTIRELSRKDIVKTKLYFLRRSYTLDCKRSSCKCTECILLRPVKFLELLNDEVFCEGLSILSGEHKYIYR